MEIQYFKALKRTNRFNKNQKIWISYRWANHLNIYYKFRGKGRYVRGIIDKFSPWVGEIKTIKVTESFGNQIILK